MTWINESLKRHQWVVIIKTLDYRFLEVTGFLQVFSTFIPAQAGISCLCFSLFLAPRPSSLFLKHV
jgi:hypothetical protein